MTQRTFEVFYEKLYVDAGLPWFIQEKDSSGKLICEHKAREVIFNAPSKTVFLPENPGGKRGFISAKGALVLGPGGIAYIQRCDVTD
jgi:hypothetical protein